MTGDGWLRKRCEARVAEGPAHCAKCGATIIPPRNSKWAKYCSLRCIVAAFGVAMAPYRRRPEVPAAGEFECAGAGLRAARSRAEVAEGVGKLDAELRAAVTPASAHVAPWPEAARSSPKTQPRPKMSPKPETAVSTGPEPVAGFAGVLGPHVHAALVSRLRAGPVQRVDVRARAIKALLAPVLDENGSLPRPIFRQIVASLHPDTPGGDAATFDAFKRLEKALLIGREDLTAEERTRKGAAESRARRAYASEAAFRPT